MAQHFQYVGLSGELSSQLAQALAQSIKTRVQRGLDVNDRPAPPLSQVYARLKSRRGLQAIRDWTLTGRTIAALVPIAGPGGQIQVGFTNGRAAQIAAINNARIRMFGVSPQDRKNLIAALNAVRYQLLRRAA